MSQAQDTAEAARQERARKQSKPKRAKHVYTNEDLARPHILVPEDSSRAEAQKNECAQQKEKDCPVRSPQNSPANLNADSAAPEIPLGDVARKYRREKELRAQKELEKRELQALKPKQPSPFHLPIQTPALAAPVLPERSATGAPIRPQQPPAVVRRDPFRAMRVQPAVPTRPALRASPMISPRAIVTPEANSKTRSAERVQPEVTAHPVSPAPLVAPVRPSQPEKKVVPSVVPSQKAVSVQPGDSLWKLAKQNLGRGDRWQELLAVNPWIADPNKIRAGAEITLPTVSDSAHSPVKIKVQKGDTLWKLAKTNLGRSSYWSCLAQANPDVHDPNLIYENQELLLPTSCNP